MKDITTIRIEVKPWLAPKGHTPHRSGAGKHGDRRLKRLKTRNNQLQNALKD